MKRFKKEDKAMTDEKFLWAYEKFRKTVYSAVYAIPTMLMSFLRIPL